MGRYFFNTFKCWRKSQEYAHAHVGPGRGGVALEWQEGLSGSSMDSQKAP